MAGGFVVIETGGGAAVEAHASAEVAVVRIDHDALRALAATDAEAFRAELRRIDAALAGFPEALRRRALEALGRLTAPPVPTPGGRSWDELAALMDRVSGRFAADPFDAEAEVGRVRDQAGGRGGGG